MKTFLLPSSYSPPIQLDGRYRKTLFFPTITWTNPAFVLFIFLEPGCSGTVPHIVRDDEAEGSTPSSPINNSQLAIDNLLIPNYFYP